MPIGDIILVLIILGVIVQLVGSYMRGQRERAEAAAAGFSNPVAEPDGESDDNGQLTDDEVPEGYVIDERRDDGRIVLRPTTAGHRENVGR